MKHVIVTVILIFMISGSVLISGCTDKGNTVTDITSSQTTDRREYENQQFELRQDLLKEIERFIDPSLENVKVEINNPNIELISFKIVDNRKYEEDTNWYIEITVQNNAKTPVWITQGLVGTINPKYTYSALLDAGERKQYGISRAQLANIKVNPKIDVDNVLTTGLTVEIYAHDTVKPKISSDFEYSFRELTQSTGDYSIPLLNLKSLTYETNDKNWRYAVFEVSNPATFQLDASIAIHVTGESRDYYWSGDNCLIFKINPGETKYIQVPLRDYDPKQLNSVNLGVKRP